MLTTANNLSNVVKNLSKAVMRFGWTVRASIHHSAFPFWLLAVRSRGFSSHIVEDVPVRVPVCLAGCLADHTAPVASYLQRRADAAYQYSELRLRVR